MAVSAAMLLLDVLNGCFLEPIKPTHRMNIHHRKII